MSAYWLIVLSYIVCDMPCCVCRSNKNVTLVLAWNVIPNAGTLPKVWGRGSHRVEFPDEYTASKFWCCLRWTGS